jgi:hypothetical protein
MRHCHSQTRRKNHYGNDISLEQMPHEPEERSALDADALALHQCLAKLEEYYRLPVVMFYFQDLSYSLTAKLPWHWNSHSGLSCHASLGRESFSMKASTRNAGPSY